MTGGVRSLLTVMVTAPEMAVLPAASRATAVRVWAPLAARTVFHDMMYGAVVTSSPRLLPSTLNCTPATPTSSVALAERVILSKTVAPVGGAVMETAGGVMSDAPPVSRWAGTLTRKASRRLPPVLLVQIKYWPVTSRLPLGYFE